ncbi:MAG: metal ABC transporter permease [Alphaproteobacteria bacterium]
MMSSFWAVDAAPLLVAILAAMNCALLGNYLLLRRHALLGDALSHVVLPGLAVAFLLTGIISPLFMMLGAGAACLLAVLLMAALSRWGGLQPSMAMGVVLTGMFALGVMLLEQQLGRQVHLDAQHALYGALEMVYWPELQQIQDLFHTETLLNMPRQLAMLWLLLLGLGVLLLLLFKETRLICFDPIFARVAGYQVGLWQLIFLGLLVLCLVAAFEAVGSILVVGFLVCPPATARLLTQNLAHQIILSSILAAFSATLGYSLAILLPAWLGIEHAFVAAPMMVLVAGLLLFTACLWQRPQSLR